MSRVLAQVLACSRVEPVQALCPSVAESAQVTRVYGTYASTGYSSPRGADASFTSIRMGHVC
jgi:hypothetical protein